MVCYQWIKLFCKVINTVKSKLTITVYFDSNKSSKNYMLYLWFDLEINFLPKLFTEYIRIIPNSENDILQNCRLNIFPVQKDHWSDPHRLCFETVAPSPTSQCADLMEQN